MSHALLSPSSAARWINCPPSALLNAEAPRIDTPYTREGTLAHAVCELKARKYFLPGIGPRKYAAELKKLKADEMWQDEMDGYTDTYLDILKDIAAGFTATPYVALEQRLEFGEYVPDGYGTADCIMIGGTTLHIIDFKYGKGVPVSAEANPQMLIYALGAVLDYEPIYDIDTVAMTIVQPRIKAEPDTWEVLTDDLMTWAEEILKPAAQLAAEGKGEFAEGDWCRFCAIRATCRARAGAITALEDFGGKLPPELTDAEVARALAQGQRLASWLTDLQEYALRACLDGKEIPGWKAVEGRSLRTWTDPDKAFEAARKAGIPDEMLYERKPVTLAALEKLMGKKPFADTLSTYVYTPAGKPTLVTADDKRQAITNKPTAKEDFEEV